MKHGSLFSGIGGFDLAAEWAGWENVFHCEINPFGQKILNHYWPNAKSYEDITKTDFNIHRGRIDILTGGFPCQPYSSAGKRLGKEDDRHLWPEMLRAIREIQPRWIVGENVLGITNWNGGLVFDEVQSDLESEGYEVQPFVLPACAVGAPHRRDRVWFVAYSVIDRSSSSGSGRETKENKCKRIKGSGKRGAGSEWFDGLFGLERDASDTNSNKRSEGRLHKEGKETSERHFSPFHSWNGGDTWKNFPTVSPICNGDDGLPTELDGITFPKWRNESIKGGGNAIVPQVAFEIFKIINQMES